jgi:pectate lyase
MKKHTLFLCLLLLAGYSYSQTLSFPGAEGFGRFAKGARAGTPSIYHVTTLNDSGTGSLRDAISQPNRIVVFDVSGVIKISSRLVFSNNLTIAGQTAPGDGITVYGNGVSFSAADNIIVRYMRFRMGSGGDSGKDAAGIANGSNMIFDHVSVSWGLDENFSILKI